MADDPVGDDDDPMDSQMLENLAHAAWVRRGRPIGSPHIDWEEAKRLLHAAKKSDERPRARASGQVAAAQHTKVGRNVRS
jgi:hypothetical protein